MQISFSEANASELDIVHFHIPAAVPEPTCAGRFVAGAPALLARRRGA